ncbi:MAG: hypothetical protein AMK72_09115 [Planctomycetes bacterium SM23_25]|nr:MAG: hypothetical protein AMK72_09115 [Planctomycetes bacterium SM23_25]
MARWLAVAVGTVVAAAAEPRVESGPAGPLVRYELRLERPQANEQPVVLLVTTYGGQVADVAAYAPRGPMREMEVIDHSDLKVSADAIRGRLRIDMHFRSHTSLGRPPYPLEVSCRIRDGAVAGEFTGRFPGKSDQPGPHEKGSLQGRVLTEQAIRAGNSLASGADWPCWMGPSQTFAAATTRAALLDDLHEARLVWRSEYVGPSEMGSIRYGDCIGSAPCAGGASPIVCDGKVYQFHYTPAGTAYMKHVDDLLRGPTAEKTRERLRQYGWDEQRLRDLWRIDADEVVLCIDAATGRTLWKTVFPGEGLALFDHKGSMTNHTPCAVEGRVYALGVTGRLRCLDAASGEVLWARPVPGFHEFMKRSKDESLAQRRVIAPGRSFTHALNWAGPAVLAPDSPGGRDAGLVGFDRATGRVRWHVKDVLGACAAPLRWPHDGKDYVIAVGSSVTCIDPEDGRTVWRLADVGHNPNQAALWNDLLLVNLMDEEAMKKQREEKMALAEARGQSYGGRQGAAGQLGCYRLTLEGPTLAWKLPPDYGFPYSKAAAVVVDGKACVRGGLGDKGFVVVDMASGKILFEDPARQNNTEAHAFAMAGRYVMEPDSQHGKTNWFVFNADPADWRPIGPEWWQPHRMVTSYQTPQSHAAVDGRVFMRSRHGVMCYDLRKALPKE